jgi:hypothetical protein
MADFDKRQRERRVEIGERQAKEMRDFEAEWNSGGKLDAFAKASRSLIEARNAQKRAALACDFPRAKELKAMGDRLEREETEAATRRAGEAMRAALMTLEQKHRRELECAVRNWERQRQKLESDQATEIGQLELGLRHLEERRTEPPAGSRRPVTRGPRGTASTSPRTRARLSEYRSTSVKKLDNVTVPAPQRPAQARGRRGRT